MAKDGHVEKQTTSASASPAPHLPRGLYHVQQNERQFHWRTLIKGRVRPGNDERGCSQHPLEPPDHCRLRHGPRLAEYVRGTVVFAGPFNGHIRPKDNDAFFKNVRGLDWKMGSMLRLCSSSRPRQLPFTASRYPQAPAANLRIRSRNFAAAHFPRRKRCGLCI